MPVRLNVVSGAPLAASLFPGVNSPALEAIVMKAMGLRPEDRYPSVAALAHDVRSPRSTVQIVLEELRQDAGPEATDRTWCRRSTR